MHFQLAFVRENTRSVTVQPKAGRWMKLGYFFNAVYIHRPSSLGLDGGAYSLAALGG